MKKRDLRFLVVVVVVMAGASIVIGQSGREKRSGIVCISRIPVPNADPVSLGNSDGGNRSFDYTIQIGAEKVVPSTEKSMSIKGLALKKAHLVRIFRGGEQISSFRFRFEKVGGEKLCLWYKPLYETWSLWPLKELTDNCNCP